MLYIKFLFVPPVGAVQFHVSVGVQLLQTTVLVSYIGLCMRLLAVYVGILHVYHGQPERVAANRQMLTTGSVGYAKRSYQTSANFSETQELEKSDAIFQFILEKQSRIPNPYGYRYVK